MTGLTLMIDLERQNQILAPSLHKIGSLSIGKYSWMTFVFGKTSLGYHIRWGKFRYNLPFRLTSEEKCEKLFYAFTWKILGQLVIFDDWFSLDKCYADIILKQTHISPLIKRQLR